VVNKDLERLGLKDQWFSLATQRDEWRTAINKKEQARFEEDEKKEEARIKEFKCPSCDMKCKSHRGLMIHLNKKHPNVCEKCGKEFKNSTGLLNHQRTCGIEDKRREKEEEESEWVSYSKQKRRKRSAPISLPTEERSPPVCSSSNSSSPEASLPKLSSSEAAPLPNPSSSTETTTAATAATEEEDDGGVKCPFYVNFKCADNRGLSSHLRFIHKVSFASLSSSPTPSTASTPSICSSSSFSNSPVFTLAAIASLPSSSSSPSTKEAKCPYCLKVCVDARGLSAHIRFKHKDEDEDRHASKTPSTKKPSTQLSSAELSSPSSDKGSFIPPRKSRSEPTT
jgi:hypothetical protein